MLGFERGDCAQVVFGVTAVIMPGTILGDGAVLGAIAAADIGQELGSNALFMGVPAISTSQHQTGTWTFFGTPHIFPACLLHERRSAFKDDSPRAFCMSVYRTLTSQCCVCGMVSTFEGSSSSVPVHVARLKKHSRSGVCLLQ